MILVTFPIPGTIMQTLLFICNPFLQLCVLYLIQLRSTRKDVNVFYLSKALNFDYFRAINNELLDTYQLKSLDGVLEAAISEVAIVKTPEGRLMLKILEEGSSPEETSESEFDNFAMREPYDRIIRCLGFKFDTDLFNRWVEFEVIHQK